MKNTQKPSYADPKFNSSSNKKYTSSFTTTNPPIKTTQYYQQSCLMKTDTSDRTKSTTLGSKTSQNYISDMAFKNMQSDYGIPAHSKIPTKINDYPGIGNSIYSKNDKSESKVPYQGYKPSSYLSKETPSKYVSSYMEELKKLEDRQREEAKKKEADEIKRKEEIRRKEEEKRKEEQKKKEEDKRKEELKKYEEDKRKDTYKKEPLYAVDALLSKSSLYQKLEKDKEKEKEKEKEKAKEKEKDIEKDKVKDNKPTEESKSRSSKARIVGLSNSGNTCYMNAALQCLIHTDKLYEYYVNFKETGKQITTEFHKFLTNVENSDDGKTLSTITLKYEIGRKFKTFAGPSQNDAQEFVISLLDLLSQELSKVGKAPYKELSFPNLPINTQADKWWEYYVDRENTIITKLFRGQLCSEIICNKNHNSRSFETFMGLSIGFGYSGKKFYGREYTLEQLMEKEFNCDEEIEEPYYCSECKAKVKCKKQITVYRSPKYLWVHIKRFKISTYSCSKIDETLEVPLTLNMKKYMKNGDVIVYSLYGIIHHLGSMNNGHYTADCKSVTGKWFHFDDEVVSQRDPKLTSSSAFLLFYKMA